MAVFCVQYDYQGVSKHVYPCNTSETECVIRDLPCGHEYNISVSAADGSCHSDHSAHITVKTGMYERETSINQAEITQPGRETGFTLEEVEKIDSCKNRDYILHD